MMRKDKFLFSAGILLTLAACGSPAPELVFDRPDDYKVAAPLHLPFARIQMTFKDVSAAEKVTTLAGFPEWRGASTQGDKARLLHMPGGDRDVAFDLSRLFFAAEKLPGDAISKLSLRVQFDQAEAVRARPDIAKEVAGVRSGGREETELFGVKVSEEDFARGIDVDCTLDKVGGLDCKARK